MLIKIRSLDTIFPDKSWVSSVNSLFSSLNFKLMRHKVFHTFWFRNSQCRQAATHPGPSIETPLWVFLQCLRQLFPEMSLKSHNGQCLFSLYRFFVWTKLFFITISPLFFNFFLICCVGVHCDGFVFFMFNIIKFTRSQQNIKFLVADQAPWRVRFFNIVY